MSTPVPPFVNFKRQDAVNIGNTPTIIFPSLEFAAILDSVRLVNIVDNSIKIFSCIVRESNQTWLSNGTIIEPFGFLNLLKDQQVGDILYMEPHDVLYAYSDFSGNLFDSLVSYRLLNELGEITP